MLTRFMSLLNVPCVRQRNKDGSRNSGINSCKQISCMSVLTFVVNLYTCFMFNLKNNMNDDIKESVIKKLNKELGADPKNLEKCELLCKNLQDEKNEIEKMVLLKILLLFYRLLLIFEILSPVHKKYSVFILKELVYMLLLERGVKSDMECCRILYCITECELLLIFKTFITLY